MSGLPSVQGIGTLTETPELRFTASGVPVTNFSVAFNERKLSNGEWIDGETTFLRCVVWREMATNAAASLTKGMRVVVEGDLRPNNYQTDDGETRYGFELAVVEIAPSLRFATARVTKVTSTESDEKPRTTKSRTR